MVKSYDCVVLGDINLDWYSTNLLSFAFSELVTNGVIEWTSIDELPGGSGLNYADFAKQMGYTTFLLGKIGDDVAGQFICDGLQKNGIELGLSKDPVLTTGKAFIVRDKNDIRFLVNNMPNANQSLSISDVEKYADIISNAQMLYVSGYCLMTSDVPRIEATLKAFEMAHQSQTQIIFDVVPHEIYKIYDFDKFRELTNKVDIFISDVSTMRRFLKLGDRSEQVTQLLAEETAELLHQEGYDKFMLRLGPSGIDFQGNWDYSQSPQAIWWETEHSRLEDKRGYGDKLAIKALRDIYKFEPISVSTL